MADYDEGATVGRQAALEHFQRFHVEIVGWFVQHQQVGGTGKKPSQDDTVALATGQCSHRS